MTKQRSFRKNILDFKELTYSIFIAKGYQEHYACEGIAFEECRSISIADAYQEHYAYEGIAFEECNIILANA